MLRQIETHSGRVKPSRSRGRSRLVVETLEDRCLLNGAPLELPAQFGSADAFVQYLHETAVTQYQSLFGAPAPSWDIYPPIFLPFLPGGFVTAMAATDSSPANFANGLTFSGTNNQVAGVNEGDIVQTDGNYIYDLTHNQLVIFQTFAGAATPRPPHIVSRIDVEGYPLAEFLDGDRVTVISSVYDGVISPYALHGFAYHVPVSPKIKVTVFDVANRAAPNVVAATFMDGNYVNSRDIDGVVYVAMSNSFVGLPVPATVTIDGESFYETRQQYLARIAGHELDLALPHTYSRGSDPDSEYVKTGFVSDPATIFRPTNNGNTSLLTIATFDVDAITPGPVHSASIMGGYASTVYASLDHMYLVTPDWSDFDGNSASTIYRFDLVGTNVNLSAIGQVNGQIGNQFAMDEQGEYLRVVTTSNWGTNQTSNLYVLTKNAGSLTVVGSLTGIAPGERLFATRFFGDKAFIVTAIVIDPLFTIDLSDPTAPRLVGELHIPGFSRYLQMIDDTHLIGIGRDGPANGSLKVSLFDVSDMAHPTEVDNYIISPDNWIWAWGSSSEAEWDHHAVSYFPESRTLAVPIYGQFGFMTVGFLDPVPDFESSLWVFGVNPTTGFLLKGTIEHDSQVRRSLRIDDQLYSIAEDSVQMHPLNDPNSAAVDVRITDEPRYTDADQVIASVGVPFAGIVQRFKVGDASGLTATIDWGDGQTSVGTIAAVAGGADRYIVTGAHTYSTRGSFSIQISFQRNGADVSTLWNFAEVAGPADPGTTDSDNLRFLTRLYNDLLHRAMDAGDKSFWTGQIASGVAPSQIAELIAKSQENYLIVVSQLYQSVLGRAAEAEGKQFWSAYLAQGNSADDLRAELLGSKEYALNHGGVIDDVVKALYENVLNRTAETGEQDFWVARVKAGLSQGDLAQSILKSEERSLLAVQGAYDKFLSRDADAPGLSYFANSLKQGRRIEDVALTIIASDEYFGRG